MSTVSGIAQRSLKLHLPIRTRLDKPLEFVQTDMQLIGILRQQKLFEDGGKQHSRRSDADGDPNYRANDETHPEATHSTSVHPITEPTDRRDEVAPELLAQPRDIDLYGVGLCTVINTVEMLRKFLLGHDAPDP